MSLKLFLLTQDPALVDDINALLELKPHWELVCYDNRDKLWISYLRNNPDLVLADLDKFDLTSGSNEGRRQLEMGKIHPLFLIISSQKMASDHGKLAAEIDAFDYLPKPIDLGRIILAMAVAEKAHERRT